MSAFGSGFSISLLGFSEEHRGLKLAREVLEGYLEDWSFVIHDESDPGWYVFRLGVLSLIQKRADSRPVLLVAFPGETFCSSTKIRLGSMRSRFLATSRGRSSFMLPHEEIPVSRNSDLVVSC
jgi:hypothetical protein